MFLTIPKNVGRRRWLVWALAVVWLTGCGHDRVESYRVPKEREVPPPVAVQPTETMRPQLHYKAPSGWEEQPPGEMRVASFRVQKDGKQADVSVIPLPGLAGSDLSNVNRWRGQVGLAAVSEEELAKLAQPVEAGGKPAQLFEQAGQNPSENEKSRILAVIQRRDGVAWFYKMTGSDELVAQQKPAFMEFLQSLQFQATEAQSSLPPSHPPMGGASPVQTVSADAPAKPNWTVPAGWQETAPGQMQLAKFLAPGDGSAKAEVSVAMIPGDGGGALANVNRWRRQIGLGPIEATDLPKQTSEIEAGGAKAMLLDVTGPDKQKRLIAASVPRGDGTWFYKLMGDEAAVAKQKAAFVQFVRSAK